MPVLFESPQNNQTQHLPMMDFAGPGTCSKGMVYYSCSHFEGCCSTDPCSTGTCPGQKNDSDEGVPIVTTVVPVETNSLIVTHTTFATVAPPLTATPLAPTTSTLASTPALTPTPTPTSTSSGAISVPSQTTIPEPSATNGSDDQHVKKLNTPAIIGISIGGAMALLILTIGLWLLFRRRRHVAKTNSSSGQSSLPSPPYDNKFMRGDVEAPNRENPHSGDVFAPFGGRADKTVQTNNANPLQSNPLNNRLPVAEDSQGRQSPRSYLNSTDTYLNNGTAAAISQIPCEIMEAEHKTTDDDNNTLPRPAPLKQDQDDAQGVGSADGPFQLDSSPVYAELESSATRTTMESSRDGEGGPPKNPGAIFVSPMSPEFPIGTALTTPNVKGFSGATANNPYPTNSNNPFTKRYGGPSSQGIGSSPQVNDSGGGRGLEAAGKEKEDAEGGRRTSKTIPSHHHHHHHHQRHPLSLTPGTFGTQLSIQEQQQSPPPPPPSRYSPPKPEPENQFVDYGIFVAGPSSSSSEPAEEPSSESGHNHRATLNPTAEEKAKNHHVTSWNHL